MENQLLLGVLLARNRWVGCGCDELLLSEVCVCVCVCVCMCVWVCR